MTDTHLPGAFGRDWVTAMIATIVGTSPIESDGAGPAAAGPATGAAAALGELDRRAGDGDFGTNLTSAFTRVEGEIAASAPQSYGAWLTCVSRGFLGTGGTSGPLFGMFFRDLARCTGAPAPSIRELAAGLEAGAATVQRYGKARVGHKTMVDALVPAAEALRRSVDDGAGPADALDVAAAAARSGALSTRGITARRGRASYVGELARGVLDPGAVAAALMLGCAAAAARGDDAPVGTAWTLA